MEIRQAAEKRGPVLVDFIAMPGTTQHVAVHDLTPPNIYCNETVRVTISKLPSPGETGGDG